MKRSRSCSPAHLGRKQRKSILTFDALKEHDQNVQALSPFALLDMAPSERHGSLSDVPILPPPSTRSSQRSRSSSPSRPNDAQYRSGHLWRAHIFVDGEVPMDIRDHADKTVFHNLMHDDAHLHRVSEKLWSKSQELVKKPTGEGEWTEALCTAIDELRPKGLDMKDWREDVKPPVQNPRSTIPQKRGQSNELLSQAVEPVVLPPAMPVFKLKDLRPDVCVGSSDGSLANALEPTKGRSIARSFLRDLQDTSGFISDPRTTTLGLRFPFLIVEAKSGATGGNLYQAQNQAAVSGSSAIQIFRSLSDLHHAQNPEIHNVSPLAFSVTTEGPIHELWLHFRRPNEEEFYMVCIGTWRTTMKDHSLNLIRHLSAVLRWGNDRLKDSIIDSLQAL